MPSLLIDVDAFAKLAHWRMLDQLSALTGIPLAACSTISSLRHRAEKAKPPLFRAGHAPGLVLEAIAQMGPLPEPDLAVLATLQDVPGIDAGEAVLFAALHYVPDSQLLTGDKRALSALAKLPAWLRAGFAGRILVVEQVLERALDLHGLTWLRDHVCEWRAIDKAAGFVMGSRCDAAEAAVREGLASYISELAKLCDPSLLAP